MDACLHSLLVFFEDIFSPVGFKGNLSLQTYAFSHGTSASGSLGERHGRPNPTCPKRIDLVLFLAMAPKGYPSFLGPCGRVIPQLDLVGVMDPLG